MQIQLASIRETLLETIQLSYQQGPPHLARDAAMSFALASLMVSFLAAPKQAVLSEWTALIVYVVNSVNAITSRRELHFNLCKRSVVQTTPWSKDVRTNQRSTDGPAVQKSLQRMQTQMSMDPTAFHQAFIRALPSNMTVFSISFNDAQNLVICGMHAKQDPFVLRLPLNRLAAREGDDSVFDYETALSEFQDILAKSKDITSNQAKPLSREEKKQWWETRMALDGRIERLLEAMETKWLSGFKAILIVNLLNRVGLVWRRRQPGLRGLQDADGTIGRHHGRNDPSQVKEAGAVHLFCGRHVQPGRSYR
jgi:hypothetical protein